MKTILIYAPNAPTSGVTNALYSLHKELDKEKFRISVISWPENIKMQKLAEGFNGDFYPFKLFYYKHPLAFRRELKNIFKNNEIDTIVFNLSYMISLVPILLAEKYNIKNIIVHSHSSKIDINSNAKRCLLTIIHIINRYRLKKHFIIRLSCSHKAGVWMYGENTRFTIVNNAIDLDKFKYNEIKRNEVRKQLNISDKVVLGNVGRLAFQKNQKFLLNVFSKVVKRVPNACLWLIGDGPLMEELQLETVRLKLIDKVIFWGNQNNVVDFLSAMDLFILPSIFEGLPVAAIEAQANGLPCVFSDSIDSNVMINSNSISKSLFDSCEEWAIAIESQLQVGRDNDALENLSDKGWDIQDAAEKLGQIYSM